MALGSESDDVDALYLQKLSSMDRMCLYELK